DDMQVRRHDLLHLAKHPRPGQCFAREELIQKFRLVGDDTVHRPVQGGAGLRLLAVEAVDLPLHLRYLKVDGARLHPLINDVAQEPDSNSGEHHHGRANTATEQPRGLIRLAGEIDIETHQESRAPTTPASAGRGTVPAATPAMVLETS